MTIIYKRKVKEQVVTVIEYETETFYLHQFKARKETGQQFYIHRSKHHSTQEYASNPWANKIYEWVDYIPEQWSKITGLKNTFKGRADRFYKIKMLAEIKLGQSASNYMQVLIEHGAVQYKKELDKVIPEAPHYQGIHNYLMRKLTQVLPVRELVETYNFKAEAFKGIAHEFDKHNKHQLIDLLKTEHHEIQTGTSGEDIATEYSSILKQYPIIQQHRYAFWDQLTHKTFTHSQEQLLEFFMDKIKRHPDFSANVATFDHREPQALMDSQLFRDIQDYDKTFAQLGSLQATSQTCVESPCAP